MTDRSVGKRRAIVIGGSISGTNGHGGSQTITAGSTYVLIPEPSTPLLMGLGLAGLLALRRIQKA